MIFILGLLEGVSNVSPHAAAAWSALHVHSLLRPHGRSSYASDIAKETEVTVSFLVLGELGDPRWCPCTRRTPTKRSLPIGHSLSRQADVGAQLSPGHKQRGALHTNGQTF